MLTAFAAMSINCYLLPVTSEFGTLWDLWKKKKRKLQKSSEDKGRVEKERKKVNEMKR